jgi:hypothetical protein
MRFRVFGLERHATVSPKVIIGAGASVLFLAAHLWSVSVRSNEQEGLMEDGKTMIDEAAAREIANNDARSVYRDLSIYKVNVKLRSGKWYVDYNLEREAMAGGGPHYVISGTTGDIVERRYEQ